MNILVSACLLGVNCKYDGSNNNVQKLEQLIKKYNLVPICPEQLGGLSTPRCASEICSGTGKEVLKGISRVISKDRKDVSQEFVKGAVEVLDIAKKYNCKIAILKQRSPSCGSGLIYDGSFNSNIVEGNGVCSQLLIDNGVKVVSEENYYTEIK